GASCVLAMDYGTTAWLSFYLPKGTCVLQPIQRIRWVNFPEPDPRQLSGTQLFVDEAQIGLRFYVTETFAAIAKIGEAERRRGPLTIETYAFYAVSRPQREVLDRTPPPELQR
ncbi:MAG: glycosyl transferase, partial [Bradyrhizobium sp.]|nr:glycosyl transferase [Bradyrhizobium sp.]